MRIKRGEQQMDFTLSRQTIKLDGVEARIIPVQGDQLVGYVKIRAFSSSTAAELTSALEDFHFRLVYSLE